MKIMPIETISDYEKRIERCDAYWNMEIIDRAFCHITFPKPVNKQVPLPEKNHSTFRERWMDVDFQVEKIDASVKNMEFYGDALPLVSPNLGPEIFSAFWGQELEYGETTSWSLPFLKDWEDVGKLNFSKENLYFKKLEEFTDACLKNGENKYYTGITDLHPGGDAIAAFRDPLHLNMDMIDCPHKVKDLLPRITKTYFEVFDHFYNRLKSANQPCTSWMPIVSTKKWYVPSNDFSCMISKEMFDDVFLESIKEECNFMEASIYHLDGTGALTHLDSLISIERLNGIQFVVGAGKNVKDWIHVFKKIFPFRNLIRINI